MKNKIKNLLIYLTTASVITSSAYTLKSKSEDNTSVIASNYTIAAHRGLSSEEVENTEKAIEEANEKDCIDYIEIDVRLTNDGEIVLSHNNDLCTSTNNIISINDETLSELENTTYKYKNFKPKEIFIDFLSNDTNKIIRRLKLLNQEYKLCTLDEALEKIENKKILLDIKFNNNVESLSEKIIETLKNNDIDKEKIIIQSSNLDALLYLKKKAPEYQYQALISNEENLEYAEIFDAIGIKKNVVDYDYVKSELDNGKIISVWTINTKKDIKNVTDELGSLSTDIIYITDYPDLITNDLNKVKEK